LDFTATRAGINSLCEATTAAMIRKIILVNSVLVVLLAGFFFIYPAVRAALDIQDPALRSPGIPKAAWRLYRNLTPRYARWAHDRVAGGQAESLSTNNISGTEWPLFGSVFYLWAIENLQTAWERGDHAAGIEPRIFAREAIIAASELVMDPKHAGWVRKHWGENYLHRENVFYRMLVIAALTSREKLLHDGAHLDMLRDQVETFAAELEATKSGLLDDYPGECYPGDVMAAIMCIKRADAVLGTDHSRFVTHALRGFTGPRLTRHYLPPYMANSATGLPSAEARGCANSYFCLTAPELWPVQARQWFELYDRFFWQERLTAVGFREYAKGLPRSSWSIDVDAGPVIAGYGVAANAFGVGAARRNGRFDRAYPLAAEMLATVGELPNGVLAVPRLLSNLSDAPMLGETAILWQLSIQPEKGFPVKTGGAIPAYVYIVLGCVFLFGTWRILDSIWKFRNALSRPAPVAWAPALQIVLWICALCAAVAAFAGGQELVGVAALVLAVLLPVVKRPKAPKGAEDWPGEKPLPGTEAPPTAAKGG
jgi:hypothetical protein